MRKNVDQVLRAFLKGKAKNFGSIYTDGKRVYSYGPHHCLVKKDVITGKYLLNTDCSSSTTNRQIADVAFFFEEWDHLGVYKRSFKKPQTNVVFRRVPGWSDRVIALFPKEREEDGTVLSYMLQSMHSTQDFQEILAMSERASVTEFKALYDELSIRGYNLKL